MKLVMTEKLSKRKIWMKAHFKNAPYWTFANEDVIIHALTYKKAMAMRKKHPYGQVFIDYDYIQSKGK